MLQLRALCGHVVEKSVRAAYFGCGLRWACMFAFAALFSCLKHVDFTMRHIEFDCHPVLRLSTLHLEHVELQFVMGSRRTSLAEGKGKIADHPT
jgi:hypothetical protein